MDRAQTGTGGWGLGLIIALSIKYVEASDEERCPNCSSSSLDEFTPSE